MTREEMAEQLRARFPDIVAEEDRWHAEVTGLRLVILLDPDQDRVRVMVPVAEIDHPDPDAFLRLLEANFDTALEARYAVYDDVLWTVFLASLTDLVEHALDRGVTQVLELARTTGTTYSARPSPIARGTFQVH